MTVYGWLTSKPKEELAQEIERTKHALFDALNQDISDTKKLELTRIAYAHLQSMEEKLKTVKKIITK